jgi:hypothetical protein
MMSYNKEDTELVINIYSEKPTKETVEYLAKKLSKSTKSIIGKLSREGVYRREVYRSKTGEVPTTKVEIVSNIASVLGIEVEDLVGLEKSPKTTLKALEEALTGSQRV